MGNRVRWEDLSDIEKALRWWRSLPPGIREVKLQALWECEGLPMPGERHGYDEDGNLTRT